ncbi:MAG: metallophosphoesterase, partial [Anaerolineae bacterium]
MAYQLLHLSDLHLDASFAADGSALSVSNWRRSDLRATLGRILTMAREHRVDAITIAGDLYDQEHALPDTGEFLAQKFAQLASIRVFIAPGEHDPYTVRSLYALTRWPPNVHIFTQGQLAPAELAPDVHLWGAAHPTT